jgi:hypothetical protein
MFKILNIFIILWVKSELYPTLIRKFLRLLILFVGMLPGFVVQFIFSGGGTEKNFIFGLFSLAVIFTILFINGAISEHKEKKKEREEKVREKLGG